MEEIRTQEVAVGAGIKQNRRMDGYLSNTLNGFGLGFFMATQLCGSPAWKIAGMCAYLGIALVMLWISLGSKPKQGPPNPVPKCKPRPL